MIRILTRGLIGISLVVATGMCQYVEDSVRVCGVAVGSLVHNSSAGVIYGCSEQADSCFTISCASNQVIARFGVSIPMYLAYNSLDNRAYLTQRTEGYDSVVVISGTTHQRIAAIPLLEALRPVWNPDNDRLYVSMDEENRVAVIDCHTNTVLCEIPVGQGPNGLVLNRPHQKLYVQNWDGESVSIIDLNTNQVIKTIAVGNVPESGCYVESAGRFYCGAGNLIVAIDGAGDTVVGAVVRPVGTAFPAMVAVEELSLVLVAGYGTGDSVYAVDATRDSIIHAVGVNRTPGSLARGAASGLVYCGHGSDYVSALTPNGSRVVATMSVGQAPFCFASVPSLRRLYVGCLSSRYVYVIRDTASGIQEQPSFGRPAAAVQIRPNPFTRSVAIIWNAALRGGDVAHVYAQDGRSVREARIPAGGTRWVWDGRDGSGTEVPAGVYTVICAAGCRTMTATLVKAR